MSATATCSLAGFFRSIYYHAEKPHKHCFSQLKVNNRKVLFFQDPSTNSF